MTKRKKKKFLRPNKFFLWILPVILVLAGAILFFSMRSFLRNKNYCCPSPDKNVSGEFEPGAKIAYFENKPVKFDLAQLYPLPKDQSLETEAILGTSADERWIEIDLSDQKVYAHEGDRIVYEFLVSTGKWGRTPTGDYRIWIKLKYTKMSGGSRELRTYYYLPNVPYVMYFHKGFGLHGTYWHQNFGEPMSHGCINMATPDAEKLFYWASPVLPQGDTIIRSSKANPGTRVVIHE